jgi:hypothetical protein
MTRFGAPASNGQSIVLVESEAITEIEYDSTRAVLFIRFVDGEWYTYFEVPSYVHGAFVAAESHGRFFQQNIRDRCRYRRGR